MKFLISAIFIIYGVHSASIKLIPPSDLEVGSLGPDDKLLVSFESAYNPIDGVTIIEHVITVYGEFGNYTYITAEETGSYPDARASLNFGGPTFNFFEIKIVPGPLRGWNYTISGYGIPNNRTKYSIKEVSKYA